MNSNEHVKGKGNFSTFDVLSIHKQINNQPMKKIYFVLAVAAAMLFAAEANAQVGFGLGYNMITSIQKVGSLDQADELDGFYVEATYNANFLEKAWGELSVEPGLRFSYGTVESKEQALGVVTKAKGTEMYLDLPVYFKFSRELNDLKLSVFAGPIASYGLSSNVKVSVNDISNTIDSYGRDYQYGRFNLKVGVGIGLLCMDRYNVKVGYDVGVLNRYTGDEKNTSCRTGVLFAGFGISF